MPAKKKDISLLIDGLKQLYPEHIIPLHHKNAWELLCAVILSAQCTDARVNIVTRELFKEYNTPEKMLTLSQEQLERYIFSCGFYRNKAAHILSASQDIVDRFQGEVPSTIEELMSLAGVGKRRRMSSIPFGLAARRLLWIPTYSVSATVWA